MERNAPQSRDIEGFFNECRQTAVFFENIQPGYYLLTRTPSKIMGVAFKLKWLSESEYYSQADQVKLMTLNFLTIGVSNQIGGISLINPFNMLGIKKSARLDLIKRRINDHENCICELEDKMNTLSDDDIRKLDFPVQKKSHITTWLSMYHTKSSISNEVLTDNSMRKELINEIEKIKEESKPGFFRELICSIKSRISSNPHIKAELIEHRLLARDPIKPFMDAISAGNIAKNAKIDEQKAGIQKEHQINIDGEKGNDSNKVENRNVNSSTIVSEPEAIKLYEEKKDHNIASGG